MGWRYQAKRVRQDFGDGYEYTVVEVFPDLKIDTDDVIPHTDETTFFGATPEDLAKWLRLAADDIEKHGCINEEDL